MEELIKEYNIWEKSGLLKDATPNNINLIVNNLNNAKNYILSNNIPINRETNLIFPIIRRIIGRTNKGLNIGDLFDKLTIESKKYFINGNEDELIFVVKFCEKF